MKIKKYLKNNLMDEENDSISEKIEKRKKPKIKRVRKVL